MPYYQVIGRGLETNRKRRRIYRGADESAVRAMAAVDGTFVEEIVELPPDPPTDAQIAYAEDLGIVIPPDVTKEQLSDLLSIKIEHDRPSSALHRSFAKCFGLDVTDYIGKKNLFDRIQLALTQPGQEVELVAWFLFRVYRGLVKGAEVAPIDSPNNPLIVEIAEKLASDDRVVKSIMRYDGRDLIWFGEWTSPDGILRTGGSTRTIAYKLAVQEIGAVIDLDHAAPNGWSTPRQSGKRIACRDGNCTGALGENGNCRTCGKPADWTEQNEKSRLAEIAPVENWYSANWPWAALLISAFFVWWVFF